MDCSQCGVCCKLFLINLSEEEYKSGKYKMMFDDESSDVISNSEMDFEEAEMVGANILKQKEDDSCIYLKEGKCSIHSFRPQVCRNFFCNSNDPKFKIMVDKIKEHKK